jgi:cytochrome P450 family 110
VVGENSLFLLEGERHLLERRLVGQPLQGARMRSYGREIVALVEDQLSCREVGDVIPMTELVEAISLGIIIRLVFGVSHEKRAQLYRDVVGRFLGSYSTLLAYVPLARRSIGPLGPWSRFVRARRDFSRLVEDDIAAAQAASSRESVLEHLRAVTDSDGRMLSQAEVRDELVTLLLAGHDTTSRGLAWALYFLHTNAGVLASVRHELTEASDREPEGALTAPYMDAVCSEVLRLNPIVNWVERVPVEPFHLLDWTVGPGDVLAPCVFLAHRREDVFPDPLAFRPERFLERKYASYEYFPFGGGTRRCIGQAFGLQVMRLVLATILAHWELELVNPGEVRPIRRGASMGPSGRLDMRIVARR